MKYLVSTLYLHLEGRVGFVAASYKALIGFILLINPSG